MKSENMERIRKVAVIAFIVIVNCMLTCIEAYSQTITFQKTIPEINIQYFWSAVQTPDNGYIAVGRKRISSFDYMYIVRFNAYGDTIWTKTMTGGEATNVIKTNDNNYALCSIVGMFVKFDINGNVLVNWSYYNEDSFINTMIQLPDGNYFMSGQSLTSPSHPYIIIYNSAGNFLKDSTYTDIFYSGLFASMIVSNNNLVLTGSFSPTSIATQNIFLMKMDFNGNVIFFNSGLNELYLHPYDVVETISGSYIVCGSFRDNDQFLAKYKNNGTFEWIKAFDTSYYGFARSVTLASDGNLVYTAILDSGSQLFSRIRKTDTNGAEIWRRTHAIKGQDQYCYDIKLTSDSGFVIAGTSGVSVEDIYLLKTDKNGMLLPPIGIEPFGNVLPNSFKLYQNYPNPFNPETNIRFDIEVTAFTELEIFDITGKKVETLIKKELKPGQYNIKFRAINFSSGFYFYRLKVTYNKKFTYTQSYKLIILK